MTTDRLKEKLRTLPDQPGVYFMRDRNRRVIYVGKAASLRKRVQSYFRKATLRSADPKLRGLIKSVADLDWLVVRTEAEAVLTEGRMIKEYRPRYNVSFRDDKRFLLMKVNLDDPVPRFSLCRIRKEDGALYFGPFASAAVARETTAFLEKRFGVRPCRPRVPDETDYKHCHNDIIRFCSAPCVGKIDPAAYQDRVREAVAFLRGERPEVLKELDAEMRTAAEAQDFERAAVLRDTLFRVRDAVKQRARGTKSPAVRKEEALAGLEQLRELLDLPTVPRVMECYDISNISGTHAVGSLVCTVDGLAARNRYRLFRIKTVEGIDDPRMMGEVLRRRFTRAAEEGTAPPDLVIVDGGITQLRAARAAMDALGFAAVPAVGLAKRFEEIVRDIDGKMTLTRLPKDSSALYVMQQIRDEAHRFALTYHRRLRSRRIRESRLDDVEGIGEKRKEQVLKHFGSIARLEKASVAQIAEVPGIGPEMAAAIHAELHRGRPDKA